jgi:hypothetical protein
MVERAARDRADTGGRLSAEQVRQAECDLGFPLPALLATAYQWIGDGGYGPENLMMALLGDFPSGAVEFYRTERAAGTGTDWAWPEGVLPILDWGAGLYSCVDCRHPDAPVLFYDPSGDAPAWYVDAPSLYEWFTRYVTDTGWWSAGEGDDEIALPPWPDAGSRAAG